MGVARFIAGIHAGSSPGWGTGSSQGYNLFLTPDPGWKTSAVRLPRRTGLQFCPMAPVTRESQLYPSDLGL